MTADFVIGCDGFHGPSRKAIPPEILKTHEMVYPFGWFGILAEAPPSNDVALFSHHERGFALLSMRSPEVARLYFQCEPDEDADQWSDEQIWDELETRLYAPNWKLIRGNITQKDVTPLRSFFSEPMHHGSLFLAGDASHIVPPTGAKGLNSAFADVSVLSAGMIDRFKKDDETILNKYTEVASRRNRQVQRFSWANTAMYHRFPGNDSFNNRMQEAQLEYLLSDETAQISYAQNHTGLPFEYWPEF